jgi:hypothetical protein
MSAGPRIERDSQGERAPGSLLDTTLCLLGFYQQGRALVSRLAETQCGCAVRRAQSDHSTLGFG